MAPLTEPGDHVPDAFALRRPDSQLMITANFLVSFAQATLIVLIGAGSCIRYTPSTNTGGDEHMPNETSLYADRIVEDPEIMVGKPTVKGTRIPVATVLGHLAGNPDLDDLFAAYPRLTVEDVQAVLAYAHDAVETQRKRARRRSATIAASVMG